MILALVGQILADAARMNGLQEVVGRDGIPLAAVLISAGFFLSSAGKGRTQPNRFIVLLWPAFCRSRQGRSRWARGSSRVDG